MAWFINGGKQLWIFPEAHRTLKGERLKSGAAVIKTKRAPHTLTLTSAFLLLWFMLVWEDHHGSSWGLCCPGSRLCWSSELLLDVQRQRRWGHQPVAAAAACHHGNTVAAVPVDARPAGSSAVSGGRGGCGGGGGGLLELLLVDFALFGPSVLEPDLHLQAWNSCQNSIWRTRSTWSQAAVYLSLWQAQRCGELRLPTDGDVFAVVELLLQLQPLVVRVHDPVLILGSRLPVCKRHKDNCSGKAKRAVAQWVELPDLLDGQRFNFLTKQLIFPQCYKLPVICYSSWNIKIEMQLEHNHPPAGQNW